MTRRRRRPHISAAGLFASCAVLSAVLVAGTYIVAGPEIPATPSATHAIETARPVEPTATPRLRTIVLPVAPDAAECIDTTDPDEIEAAVLDGRLPETAIEDPDSIEEAC